MVFINNSNLFFMEVDIEDLKVAGAGGFGIVQSILLHSQSILSLIISVLTIFYILIKIKKETKKNKDKDV